MERIFKHKIFLAKITKTRFDLKKCNSWWKKDLLESFLLCFVSNEISLEFNSTFIEWLQPWFADEGHLSTGYKTMNTRNAKPFERLSVASGNLADKNNKFWLFSTLKRLEITPLLLLRLWFFWNRITISLFKNVKIHRALLPIKHHSTFGTKTELC